MTVTDVLAITTASRREAPIKWPLQTRNVLKRLFVYAIAREKVTFNPAAAIEAKFIANRQKPRRGAIA